MNEKNMAIREKCKKGMTSGALLAGFAALFTLYVANKKMVPVTDVYLNRSALPIVIGMGFLFLIIGICVMVKNKKQLEQIDREEQRYQAGSSRTAQAAGRSQTGNRGADSVGYAYYYCEHCGRKLRIAGGKGRLEVTCPVCGYRFQVTR